MRITRLVPLALGAALLYGAAGPTRAGTNIFEDTKRGFTTRVPDTLKQVPPNPTGTAKYLAAEFYDDMPKYKGSGSTNPEFKITWWSTPKQAVTPGGAKPPGDAAGDGGGKASDQPDPSEGYGPKSFEEEIDGLVQRNAPQNLFGPASTPSLNELWASAKAGKTNKQKLDFKYVELNTTKPKDKKQEPPKWYLFAAKLTLERPNESVVVGFHGFCAVNFAKDLGPIYLNVVKAFETKEGATGVAREKIPDDPDEFREFVHTKKVIPGWKCVDSPKKQYILLYDEAVKEDLVKEIGLEIEAIRAQIYEKVFPPDKAVNAVSVIRICKDKEGYTAYGGSGGSAGYWSWMSRELVFYEDKQNPKDALRVLYHEAFHQYIFYSVGAMSPHSWFNEGHGDYFSGHSYKSGKFELGEFLWRKDLAASLKREKRTVPLREWLTWDQQKYYRKEANGKGLDGGDNYALGWNFIYFLRTTKKPEYQGMLDRYFNKLKSLVTAARAERQKLRDEAKAKGEPVEPESPEIEAIYNDMHETEWCEAALAELLKGVDVDQLEKDWLAF